MINIPVVAKKFDLTFYQVRDRFRANPEFQEAMVGVFQELLFELYNNIMLRAGGKDIKAVSVAELKFLREEVQGSCFGLAENKAQKEEGKASSSISAYMEKVMQNVDSGDASSRGSSGQSGGTSKSPK